MTHPFGPLALLALLVFLSSCSKQEKSSEAPKPPVVADGLVVDYDAAEMAKAIATARSRVGEFLEELEKGDADSYSVNVAITDTKGTEQFWLSSVSHIDGQFTGNIENDPDIVGNVKKGQIWTVAQEEISDWMVAKDGKIHGGFTIDPLLATYPADEAEALRAKLVR